MFHALIFFSKFDLRTRKKVILMLPINPLRPYLGLMRAIRCNFRGLCSWRFRRRRRHTRIIRRFYFRVRNCRYFGRLIWQDLLLSHILYDRWIFKMF
jgi:hypothetical protein